MIDSSQTDGDKGKHSRDAARSAPDAASRREIGVHSNEAVAGIDVGGSKKGFHLVILRGGEIAHVSWSTEPLALHRQCMDFDVAAVGIDAPSQWSAQGAGRAAEREMARERISCFATPTEAGARANTSGFYEWMFNGLRLYEAFAHTHPLLKTPQLEEGARASFETFPHAITCAYLPRDEVSAKLKHVQRRKLVEDLGLDIAQLKSIDFLDAALCAHTAHRLMQGKARAYGNAESGFIYVPKEGF